MAMKYVQLYYSYRQVVSRLSNEEKGQLFDAIIDYAEHKREPKLSGRVEVLFPAFAMQIDRDQIAYEEKCRKSREAARMRWHADGTQGEREGEGEGEGKGELTSFKQSRARGKRKLKNNSETTIRKEDLFVPFWELEGLDDDDCSDAKKDVPSSENGENDNIM